MKNLRKNEFLDLMEMNELLFEEKEFSVLADIPEIGSVTYFPKKDKINIHKGNKWIESGFSYIKNNLKNK